MLFQPLHAIRSATCLALCISGLLFSGCTGSQDDPRIQSNMTAEYAHKHVVAIRYRQIQSGLRTFLLEENAGHNHVIELSLEDTALLELGFPVVVESSTNALHSHQVMLQKFQL